MWTRVELKNAAKSFLRKSYWLAFAVSLLMVLLGGGESGSAFEWSLNTPTEEYNQQFDTGVIGGADGPTDIMVENSGILEKILEFPTPGDFFYKPIIRGIMGIFQTSAYLFILLLTVGGLLFSIFVGFPINYGGHKFFLDAARGDMNFDKIWHGFKDDYGRIVGTYFLQMLFTFLWTLLLVIPGVIKGYSYSMTRYILRDYPELSPTEAITRSKEMCNGHKWNMFVLDLSFIGWHLLGMLLFGIGEFFLAPYIHATKAQLYLKLRELGGYDQEGNNEEEYEAF